MPHLTLQCYFFAASSGKSTTIGVSSCVYIWVLIQDPETAFKVRLDLTVCDFGWSMVQHKNCKKIGLNQASKPLWVHGDRRGAAMDPPGEAPGSWIDAMPIDESIHDAISRLNEC